MGYSLTTQQVKDIKLRRAEGKNYFELGKEFKITFQHAQSICSNKSRTLEPSPDLPGEKWKVVPSIPILQASNLGRIKRVETGRVLCGGVMKKSGYIQIGFSFNSKKMNKTAHRLVAEAWLGSCPKGLQVNHINGEKVDNKIKNLEYVTPSRNKKHAFEIGLESAVGEQNGRAKLTKENVLEIRRLASVTDFTSARIADRFGISQSHCSHIINKTFWSHI